MAGLAIKNTMDLLFNKIPLLRNSYWEKSARPKPMWMTRLQAAAGPHKPDKDPHHGGRALDIVLFAYVPTELTLANKIVRVFLELREKMNWGAVIYNQKIWTSSGVEKPRLKNGDGSFEHITHIHIEWKAENMNFTGFEFELEKRLQKINDGKSFYLYFGNGDAQKIRQQTRICAEKIQASGGKITDVLSIWTDCVVKIGDEIPRMPGDPFETDLEKAKGLGIEIIDTNELDSRL